VAENNHDEIAALDLPKFFGSSVRRALGEAGDVIWLRELPSSTPKFSADCGVGVHGGYSVIYHQLQLALHMGIREIYLIGLDFSFDVPKTTGESCIHGQILEGRGEINHFHKDYRKPGEKWTMPRLDEQRKAFLCAREACQARQCAVANASRHTRLDVFPCVELDEVLKKPVTSSSMPHYAPNFSPCPKSGV